MNPDTENHHRRSIRLLGYNYSQPGAYFITLVTHGRLCLFGEIVDGQMRLNTAGEIVLNIWNDLPRRFPEVILGTAGVMPNHFHAVVEIQEITVNPVGAIHELPLQNQLTQRTSRRKMTLPLLVGYFKMNTAKRINRLINSPGIPIWQRNYYEHIIRNEDDLQAIHLYIAANPVNWPDDGEYPG